MSVASTATTAHILSRLFTPCYVSRINRQIVHPATSVIVKPNELESALARPLHVAQYEPERSPGYLAAQLSYGIIMGHPFMDGNKRTGKYVLSAPPMIDQVHVAKAFFLANEYLRMQGRLGLTDGLEGADALHHLAQRYVQVAAGELGIEALAASMR
ncbi:hypothetical protein A7U60_g4338 [Sanghuangporus baumii]|uniref:Fido domain-containing protein n=1 Tax=Sanghuangporus baumii TaxID=108892 RepID=A0A9Q5HYU9_SANBA|nr:hypothetical protein A7U60_g4338 [Sanghuangporus baumii]